MTVAALNSFRLAWVQVFLAVVIEGSYSAAARAIGCNQSTVSRSIEHLNSFVKGNLFEGETPAKLTALGQAFLPKAEQMMDWTSACRKLSEAVIKAEAEAESRPLRRRKPALRVWLS